MGMNIENVNVSIPCLPFVNLPMDLQEISIHHEQEGNIVTFTIPHQFYWMAQITGVTITYESKV